MKVICVRDEEYNEVVPTEEYAPPMPRIPVGTICTVIDTSKYVGMVFYLFAEYYDAKYKYWYPSHDFIPLSDIDETKMVRDINLINQA